MNGFQLEFFIQQDQFHRGKPLSEWMVETARLHGIRGITVIKASTGFGEDHRTHAMNLFGLVNHPMQVTLVATDAECKRFTDLLVHEHLHLFYVKLPVEFGKIGA